jgi:tetratricopeptide (TPR) repeat protein
MIESNIIDYSPTTPPNNPLHLSPFRIDAVCLSINKDDVARSKRDVYYCNLAACLQQMGRDQEAVDACSQAIEASPKYIKAYMRRGQTLEKMERFQDAINDMTSVLEIEPGNDLARKRKVRLERFEEQRMEKLKTETMDKLKDLGNSFLSNFGMSTDNFKFEQDPSTGSYNVQFVQNPGGEESSSSS